MPTEQPLHPRPQLARERWTDLTGTWDFAYDDADRGLAERWQDRPECFDQKITVPFPPESSASGIGDPAPHTVLWYRRTFRIRAKERADGGVPKRFLLHFGAIDYRARVWVNGFLVCEHEGGHTPLKADITSALVAGEGDQTIVVRAEDQATDLTQPRGKQFWEEEP
nr:glycoside hydrolase family 2 [Chloroflexota bacterium]